MLLFISFTLQLHHLSKQHIPYFSAVSRLVVDAHFFFFVSESFSLLCCIIRCHAFEHNLSWRCLVYVQGMAQRRHLHTDYKTKYVQPTTGVCTTKRFFPFQNVGGSQTEIGSARKEDDDNGVDDSIIMYCFLLFTIFSTCYLVCSDNDGTVMLAHFVDF